MKAKALDLLRGLLPAGSLSHMGIYATGQTYEQLILHLLAHPLPEARSYGAMILEEVQTVMPSFVTRVERPDRGGEWIGYLESRARAGERWARRLGLDRRAADDATGPSVRLSTSTATRRICCARCCSSRRPAPRTDPRGGPGARRRRARRRCWPTSSASAPTAATGPGGALRRCATGLRSSPTTAPSGICSATGC